MESNGIQTVVWRLVKVRNKESVSRYLPETPPPPLGYVGTQGQLFSVENQRAKTRAIGSNLHRSRLRGIGHNACLSIR